MLQVCVFHNLAMVLSRPEWVSLVMEMVTTSLKDERIEVRDKTATVLTGLIHCQFVDTKAREELMVRIVKVSFCSGDLGIYFVPALKCYKCTRGNMSETW